MSEGLPRVRQPGFYWVKLGVTGRVTIAQWRDFLNTWTVAGWDGWYDDGEVEVVSERLTPPGE